MDYGKQVQDWWKINALLDLPPFNPDATCPKCGHDTITCQWRTASGPVTGHRPPADEWLSRRCDRCGYIWDEACIDLGGGA